MGEWVVVDDFGNIVSMPGSHLAAEAIAGSSPIYRVAFVSK